MGEFQNCVSILLDAFASGITIIKAQRRRRKQERIAIDSTSKTAETHLSKSLRKNKSDVRTAYRRDLSRHGRGFAVGDAEAHSSLSAILIRLNAGFVSVIDRFTRGKSTLADYQALVNLSNTSRIEAMDTFEKLSRRLSKPQKKNPSAHGSEAGHRRRTKTGSTAHAKHIRSKSAPELSPTPLGPTTPEGWVRPKPGRTQSSGSKATVPGTSSLKRSTPKTQYPGAPDPGRIVGSPKVSPKSTQDNRKSTMSFASDSTKIGEIPDHKWARPSMFENENPNFPITAFYPLEPYQEPEKQRSRLRRLFRI